MMKRSKVSCCSAAVVLALMGCVEGKKMAPGPAGSGGNLAGVGGGGPLGDPGDDPEDPDEGEDIDLWSEPVELRPTLENVVVDFGLDVQGQGANFVGPLEVGQGPNTAVRLGGQPASLLVYERQPASDGTPGHFWFRGVAQTRDDLWIVLLECRGEQLQRVMWQSVTRGQLGNEPATGICLHENLPRAQVADFPTLTLGDLYGQRQGFAIGGPNIRLEGTTADFLQLGGQRYDVLVLDVLPCGSQQRCVPGEERTELPVVLIGGGGRQLELASIWLDAAAPRQVTLTPRLSLPGAERLPAAELMAEWRTGRQ